MQDELERLWIEIRELRELIVAERRPIEGVSQYLEDVQRTYVMLSALTDRLSPLVERTRGIIPLPIFGELDIRQFGKIFFSRLARLYPLWLTLFIMVTGGGFLALRSNADQSWPYEGGIYPAWMAFTTIGYGDVHPEGSLAQVIAVLFGLLGVLSAGVIVA